MNGQDNLIPTSMRSKEEARELGRQGGIASGKARREKKMFRELLQMAFDKEITNSVTGEKLTRKAVAMERLAAACAKGDTKSIELAAKLLGEAVVKHELTGADGTPIQMQATPPQVLTAEQLAEAAAQIEKDIQERIEK